ncbi:hypothetical protein CRI93_14895 [Longimonas halophila]|uniref:Uncharacterized protein n=1 Tax=Longimonas halophila TaxID=1469170 RepID=A0A2H3P3G1_9BACT|nr:hypothetical protein [Longimonas halophila]PEN04625.1 hypothetical protein CRI93_14895 [Longimonas halophila]
MATPDLIEELKSARSKVNRAEDALNLYVDYLKATESAHADLIESTQYDLLSALDSVARIERELNEDS